MANIPVDIVSERFISIQGNRLRFLIKNNSIFHCHDCRPGCLRIPNGMLSLRNLYKSRQMVGSCFFPSCQLRHLWIGTYWTSWPGSCLSQDEMTPTQPFIFQMRCRGLEDRGSVLDGPADVPCFALYINVMRKNERTPLDPRRLFCLRVWRYWTSVLLVLSKPQTGRKVKSYCELPFCLFRGCHILQLFSLFSPMCLGYPKLVGTVFGNIQVKS